MRDMASINMAQYIINNYKFKKTHDIFDDNPIYVKNNVSLLQTSQELLYLNEPRFNPDAYIFLSCHKSKSGTPSLTAHFPGNFSKINSFGGAPSDLAHTYPSLHKQYFNQLNQLKNKVIGYSIVTEPMHHGPTSFSKPVLFIEIGSSETQWKDNIAIETVCDAIMKTIENIYLEAKISIGFGGPHYSEKFTKFIINSDYALGAIMPKHALSNINQSILNQMINRSIEKVSYALLDWKGINNKEEVVSLIDSAGLKIVKI